MPRRCIRCSQRFRRPAQLAEITRTTVNAARHRPTIRSRRSTDIPAIWQHSIAAKCRIDTEKQKAAPANRSGQVGKGNRETAHYGDFGAFAVKQITRALRFRPRWQPYGLLCASVHMMSGRLPGQSVTALREASHRAVATCCWPIRVRGSVWQRRGAGRAHWGSNRSAMKARNLHSRVRPRPGISRGSGSCRRHTA